MYVIVLGSGVIGTTTAYYLARQGAKVTVLDRQPKGLVMKPAMRMRARFRRAIPRPGQRPVSL